MASATPFSYMASMSFLKRLPIIPTLVVLVAALAMVRLGLWQLDRAGQKEALIARYTAAQALPPIAYPLVPRAPDALLFRRAHAFCLQPVGWRIEPGRSAAGAMGWRHLAACRTGAEGPGLTVDAGWTSDYKVKPSWRGGDVAGVVAPLPEHRSVLAAMLTQHAPAAAMLVAANPAPGLQPSAPPDLTEIPNNHRSYAVQWFIFAGLAVLIYAIALWRRLSDGETATP